ncbi:MAG: AAA family ATPase [Clostridiaceae bacterium]|nr:AAA family ATPase [Clostridiaceae bacterium]
MKIESIKINSFGNLKNREIELKENINIIEGKNESGKSTLLKYITNIFYGTSKNKKGKEISDYDKYNPWDNGEFSGKLKYTLNNGEKYEIFRDFNKKNPIIYNEQLEDISKQYNIDKTNGNQFFVEQTGIDEDMFLSTLVSMQQEVKIDQNTQNALVQKVANLAGTGDDNISYKKAIEKINKKQLEDIGTSRSQGRPINIIKEEKFKIQDEIGELETYKERKEKIQKSKNEIEYELKQIEEYLQIIKKAKEIKEKQELDIEKIKINENIKTNYEQRKTELSKEIEKIKAENPEVINKSKKEKISRKSNKKNVATLLLILGILIEIINILLIKNNVILFIFLIEIIISTFSIILINKKENKNIKQEKRQNEQIEKQGQEINEKLAKKEAEINILQNNIKDQEEQIKMQKEKIELEQNIEKERLKKESNKNQIVEDIFEYLNISYKLQEQEGEKNSKILELKSLELEEKEAEPRLEKIASLEERFEILKLREQELLKDNEAIEITKQVLEIAYKKMKQNVTPKLTEELSENIKKISNEKYSKIVLNEQNGMMVEKENGEYLSLEKLSIGTIDQLYLSLRLAMTKEVTKENMPIILDESFAYYDDERLENILKCLNTEYRNNQILIFTCANREKQILDKLNIEYNNVKL